MMTPTEKVAKAKEILNSNPSEEDLCIAVGLVRGAVADHDAEALYLLGRLHYDGFGVEKDHAKSLELCQQALAGGCEKAKTLLAVFYIMGDLVERDFPRSKQYLRDRIADHDGIACLIMGNYVFQGAFADEEWAGFADYYKKAMDNGEPAAMIYLAEKLSIICETEQAEYWYRKAEEAGLPDVESSRAQFTEDNYPERRQETLNFYVVQGMYDKAISLVDRDAATGDMQARYLQAAQYAHGLGNDNYGQDVQRAISLYERLVAEGETEAYSHLGQVYKTMHDWQKAFDNYMKAAKAGHTYAQCQVGKFYLMGVLGGADQEKGRTWIERAAAQNEPNALFFQAANYLQDGEIGCISSGLGYGRDEAKGLNLLQQAADGGSNDAQLSLALCHQMGKYMEQDDQMAYQLLKASYEANATPEKARMLGDALADGKGVEQDYAQAATLYSWAGDHGDLPAIARLARLYSEGLGVEKNEEMGKALLKRAHDLLRWRVFDIMPLHIAQAEAEKGDAKAMYQLGNRYQEGDDVERDLEQAVAWWIKADEAGEINATHNLGAYYTSLDDRLRAEHYLMKAIEADHTASLHTLATLYLKHTDEEGNVQKAINLITKAAEKDYPLAQMDLANYYYNGIHVDKDLDKSRYWLEKCVENDHPRAHYVKGYLLYAGKMYNQNKQLAAWYLRKAVEGGEHDADDLYIDLKWFGLGIEADKEEVLDVYTNLANQNDAMAMLRLYLFHDEDEPNMIDTDTAMDYLKRSAKLGCAEAIRCLAEHYLRAKYVEQDIPKAIELYSKAAEMGHTGAAAMAANLYINGVTGVIEPDCDKAIEMLTPHLASRDPIIDFYMATALHKKLLTKNGYASELAKLAFLHMKKAAEVGYVEAMEKLAYFYLTGIGTIPKTDECKKWIQKCIYHGGTCQDENYPECYTEEKLGDYSTANMLNYCHTIATNNPDSIEEPMPTEDENGNWIITNIFMCAAQAGEPNSIYSLAARGLNILKENPDEALSYIKAASRYGYPDCACRAGKEWLKEGYDNEEAVEKAIEYFGIGVDCCYPECFLEMGLLLTDERVDYKKQKREARKSGKRYLEAIAALEDEEYEEERQQALARLEELKHATAWGKIIGKVNKLLDSNLSND